MGLGAMSIKSLPEYIVKRSRDKNNSAWDTFGWVLLSVVLSVAMIFVSFLIMGGFIYWLGYNLHEWNSAVPPITYADAVYIAIPLTVARLWYSKASTNDG